MILTQICQSSKICVLDSYRNTYIDACATQCPREHWAQSWLEVDHLADPVARQLPSTPRVLPTLKGGQPTCPSSLTDAISHCKWFNSFSGFYNSISSEFSSHKWLHFLTCKEFSPRLDECLPVRQATSNQRPAGLPAHSQPYHSHSCRLPQ